MALPVQASVRNRLLAALSPADFSLLEPQLEPVPLPVRTCLAEQTNVVVGVAQADCWGECWGAVSLAD